MAKLKNFEFVELKRDETQRHPLRAKVKLEILVRER